MYKRYFRKKNPNCKQEEIEWIEMTGREFYRFVRAPENKNRYFIDMGNVVLETNEVEAREYWAEKARSDYLKKQEQKYTVLSLHALEDEFGCSGEEAIEDPTQDIEKKAMYSMEVGKLYEALAAIDAESYALIYALYLADDRKTERKLAIEYGLSNNAIHKQKKKILKKLKFLVGKM